MKTEVPNETGRGEKVGIPEPVYTVKEAAELYFQAKVSRRQVNSLYHKGQLRGFRVGAKILIYQSSLDHYRSQHENQPAATSAKKLPPVVPLKPRAKRRAGNEAGYEFFPPKPRS